MEDDASQRHSWMADQGETPYTLTIERGQVTISYENPPEYHYTLSDYCSLAEFVDGKLNENVRRLFGAVSFAQALAAARADLAKQSP